MASAVVDEQHNTLVTHPLQLRLVMWIRTVTAVLVGLVVLTTTGLAALTMTTADEGLGPKLLNRHLLVVRSGSMEPALRTGALAITRPVSASDIAQLSPGTVVVYRSLADPEMLIMHRIVARTENSRGEVQFVTKGDANVVEDSLLLDSSRIVGTLSFSLSHAGYMVAALEQGQLLRLVLLAFVLVSIAVVLSKWAARPELPKEKQ